MSKHFQIAKILNLLAWKRIFLQKPNFFSSFSAVSTPIFATKYALESSWRDLQIPHSPRDRNFQIFANFHRDIFQEKTRIVKIKIDVFLKLCHICQLSVKGRINFRFRFILQSQRRCAHPICRLRRFSLEEDRFFPAQRPAVKQPPDLRCFFGEVRNESRRVWVTRYHPISEDSALQNIFMPDIYTELYMRSSFGI